MLKKIIPFFVAVAGILYFMYQNNDNKSSEDQYYVMFVLQWPISVCIFEVIDKRKGLGNDVSPQQSCRFPQKQLGWTIHGIWNNRSSGNRCSSPPLEKSDIENITAQLNERWVQVKKFEDNFKFWRYQWEKHGSCLLGQANFNNAHEYFKQALSFHRQFDPTAALLACGMPPDDKTSYNNIQFVECLKEQLNITSKIVLSFKNDFIYRDGAPSLREIRICLDENFILTDCQDSDGISIDFYYPSSVENKNEEPRPVAILYDLFCGFSQSACDLFNNLNHFEI